MAREPEGFREILLVLKETFPDKNFLTPKEICDYYGEGRTYWYVLTRDGTFPYEQRGGKCGKIKVSIILFARYLARQETRHKRAM